MAQMQTYKHKLMFVFETKNLVIETNDLDDLSNSSWFRELVEINAPIEEEVEPQPQQQQRPPMPPAFQRQQFPPRPFPQPGAGINPDEVPNPY